MMTSNEACFTSKRINDTSKKLPLKVVSPIIKKYSGQRQGRIKKKSDFPRRLTRKKTKNTKQTKQSLKSILPKTSAGDVVIVESDLIPCAFNIQTKRKREESDHDNETVKPLGKLNDDKQPKTSFTKETDLKVNKSRVNLTSKKKKNLKNIEATFTLLKPQTEAYKEKREQAFAENYLERVQQKLKGKDDALYTNFIDLVSNFQKRGIQVCELYRRVKHLFSKYSDLGEDFIAFLTPQQAIECGVFVEYLLLTTMSDFLRMIDVYFLKSPQQVKKIHLVLEKLSVKENVTLDDVTNEILPLLKGNTVLQDYFLRLLPQGAPPSNFFMDFEEVAYSELNSDVSEDEEHFEIVKVPEVEDLFGSDSCPCNCHNSDDMNFRGRIVHCTSCSVKFINGKIFIQNGKLLRPAKVTFEDYDMAYHRDRLAPKHYPCRGRKKTRMGVFKENLSPAKSCYLSSDEFKSDIEDDEKIKSKLGLSKSPRTINRKISSPKICDKNVARAIFNDADNEERTIGSKCTINFQKDDKSCKAAEDAAEDIGYLLNFENRVKDKIVESNENVEEKVKSLDLPLIDEEVYYDGNVSEKNKEVINSFSNVPLGINSPVLVGKEGSKSPPVISIPDTGNPSLFPSGKPILSFLDNLDYSKEPALLISDNDGILNFESLPNSARNDSGKSIVLKDTKGEVVVEEEEEEGEEEDEEIEEEVEEEEEEVEVEVEEEVDEEIDEEVEEEEEEEEEEEDEEDEEEEEEEEEQEEQEEEELEEEEEEEERGENGNGKNTSPWKIEEDRIILQTLQVEENCDETFRRINEKIPTRSLGDIKKRFANLMNILYEMKAKNEPK